MSNSDVKAPIKRLTLNRETVKNLNVRTGVQTGFLAVGGTGIGCVIKSAGSLAGTLHACVSVSVNGEGIY